MATSTPSQTYPLPHSPPHPPTRVIHTAIAGNTQRVQATYSSPEGVNRTWTRARQACSDTLCTCRTRLPDPIPPALFGPAAREREASIEKHVAEAYLKAVAGRDALPHMGSAGFEGYGKEKAQVGTVRALIAPATSAH